jgi:hypothetical protein
MFLKGSPIAKHTRNSHIFIHPPQIEVKSLPARAHQAGGIGGGRKRRAVVTLTQDTLLIRGKHSHRAHLHSH